MIWFVMSRTPRKRTPSGHFDFELKGWFELIKPSEIGGKKPS